MPIKFNPASVTSTPVAATVDPQPHTVRNDDLLELAVGNQKIELHIGSCDFLKGPRDAVPQLATAWVIRFQQYQQEKAAKASEGKLAKIWKIIFPSALDKRIVKQIHDIGINCISDFSYRRGAQVKEFAGQLHQFRVAHPAEFCKALPGMTKRDVGVLCNSLIAHANMWEATDEIYNANPDAVERKINRAVKHFQKSGVAVDDASLVQFRDAYYHAANALRAAKQAEGVVAPAA